MAQRKLVRTEIIGRNVYTDGEVTEFKIADLDSVRFDSGVEHALAMADLFEDLSLEWPKIAAEGWDAT